MLPGPRWLELRRAKRRIDRAFRKGMGRAPEWRHPRDFSDKLQWLKLHHRDPRMVVVADKLAAREWVRARAGAELLTPLLGVWERPDDIDFGELTGRFVLKHNSASGYNCFCDAREGFDPDAVRRRLADWLARGYGAKWGEWHYARMPRRILCEPHLAPDGEPLWEFKLFCFDGDTKLALVVRDRFGRPASAYLDREGRTLAMGRRRDPPHDPLAPGEIPLDAWERMVAAARRIAEPFPFARVDLYRLADGSVRFGEVTFFPLSGMTPIEPPSMDRRLGDWLRLPR